jgi:hypothetical protein
MFQARMQKMAESNQKEMMVDEADDQHDDDS